MIDSTDILLDYIFELEVNYSKLASPDVCEMFNRPHHGLGRRKLSKALIDANSLGHIQFFSDLGIVNDSNISVLDLERHDYVVSLTAMGGRRWEEVFEPIWTMYFFDESSICPDSKCELVEIQAGSKKLIDHILGKIRDEEVTSPNQNITLLSPWNATYWKVVQEGYSVKLKMLEEATDVFRDIREEFKWRRPLR